MDGIDEVYRRARATRLRQITDELRERLRPFSKDLDPWVFEDELEEMAERRVAEEERGLR